MKTWRKMDAAQWNKIKQSKTNVHAAWILEFHVICMVPCMSPKHMDLNWEDLPHI